MTVHADKVEKCEVEVIQFLMPHGRRIKNATNIPCRHREAYLAMKEAGCELQAEMLMTREVSLTISDGEEDVDIRVVPNGPGVQQAIGEMLDARQWVSSSEAGR